VTGDCLRVANCSGFYGDRLSAAREMVTGGPIDVLTGDYLAELTMFLLYKARQRPGGVGYARTFLTQMEQVLGTCLDRGIKVVANAGGLDPAALAADLGALTERLGLTARIAHIEGDDLSGRLGDLRAAGHEFRHLDTGQPLASLDRPVATANAYLGAWGIADALMAGADIVVCPRVTDASLVVGPAAWRFGWRRDDWDRLAGAVAAGHVIECGPQATGGNYALLDEPRAPGLPGFPLAEIYADGSAVITKHPGTGGMVSVGTVTAQLLYEIGSARYFNPDVVARFDTVQLEPAGPDRVRMYGTRGEPAPDQLKVCINYSGGYRNTMTFVLTGLDIKEKAAMAERDLFTALGGADQYDSVDVQLIRTDRPDPRTNDEASAQLRVTVKDSDARKAGRRFSGAVVELALSSYPGFYLTSAPSRESEYAVYWPSTLPADEVTQVVVRPDGTRTVVPPTPSAPGPALTVPVPAGPLPDPAGALNRVPLGRAFGARSGDKGGNANLGVWARSAVGYAWLTRELTADRLASLLPELKELEITRHEFPAMLAVNFIITGLLGEGVASSARPDAQAKSLGEFLRARVIELPESLLAPSAPPSG